MGFVNSKNSTRPDGKYTEVIKQINKDAVCPFCPDHLNKYHKKPLKEKRFWWVTDNMYPYSPVKHHRIFIHKSHISDIGEISVEAWVEILDLLKKESRRLDIRGGTFVMRFGETRYTGGSVTHLHTHLVQSDPDHNSYDPKKGLIMRIG